MTSELDTASDYYASRGSDDKADALRRRQLQDQQTLARLQNRTDYVVQPGVVGTQNQSLRRIPVGDVQRMPVGQQIVSNPALLRNVIMPTPMPGVPRPVPVSNKPYVQKIQKPPMQNVPSMLYTMGLQPVAPVKKWPTSFKKAFHKPTPDENIMRGLNNLDGMSRSLLGGVKKNGR